jgi:hypothetical protein
MTTSLTIKMRGIPSLILMNQFTGWLWGKMMLTDYIPKPFFVKDFIRREVLFHKETTGES